MQHYTFVIPSLIYINELYQSTLCMVYIYRYPKFHSPLVSCEKNQKQKEKGEEKFTCSYLCLLSFSFLLIYISQWWLHTITIFFLYINNKRNVYSSSSLWFWMKLISLYQMNYMSILPILPHSLCDESMLHLCLFFPECRPRVSYGNRREGNKL